MTQWHTQPDMRHPVQAEDEYDDVWPLPIPRSARRYTPLEQRPQVRPVLVVNRRRERPNRQFPASPIPPRSSAYQQRQRGYTQQAAGLPQPQVRRTQDDPQYQQRQYRQAPSHDEALSRDEQQVPIQEEEEESIRRRRPRWHRLFYLGLGMLGMLLLWYLSLTLISWWHVYQDDLHYGRPRTFQMDAVVGHNDSADHPSHFLAINLNRLVEIIEFPGGDATKARIYLGPSLVGPGEDLTPVTLIFRDVNGDGKPDMLVDIQGSEVVFLNDGGHFRPPKPGDHVHL